MIFSGVVSLFLHRSLDAKCGSPSSKKMQYNFRQQYFPGLIQRSFRIIFFSQNFQEVIKNSEILGTMSAIHSALFCSFQYFDTF